MFKKFLAVLAMLATTLAMAAVDVNKATEAELDSVKGIGPGTSKQILDERKKAPFKNWDDFITRVKGVGEARATNLSEAGLTVGGSSYKPATTDAKKDEKASSKAAAKKDDKAAMKDDKASAKKDDKASAKKDDKAAAKADGKAAAKDGKADAKAGTGASTAAKKDDNAAAAPKAAASAAKK